MRSIAHALVLALIPAQVWAASIRTAWKVGANDSARNHLYRPAPVLFVHGYSSNDESFDAASCALILLYAGAYDLPTSAESLVGSAADMTRNYNIEQRAFTHSFNYGDRHARQEYTSNHNSFLHTEWQVQIAARSVPVYNKYLNRTYIAGPIIADHESLKERVSLIRDAYRPEDVLTRPRISLVCHSAGGAALTHYYMTTPNAAASVQRVITLGSPHLGSAHANFYVKHAALHWSKNFWGVVDPRKGGILCEMFRQTAGCYYSPVKGNFVYALDGIMEDLMLDVNDQNPFLSGLRKTPVPGNVEYVFNVFNNSMPRLSTGLVLPAGITGGISVRNEIWHGDGIVAAYSQAGKRDRDAPSCFKGVDPVIFGPWGAIDEDERAFHTKETTHMRAILSSLDGVAYDWQNEHSPWRVNEQRTPYYAQYYERNQSFSKYLPESEQSAETTVMHTDRPGLDTRLCIRKSDGHLFLFPTLERGDMTDAEWVMNLGFPEHAVPVVITEPGQVTMRALTITGCKNAGHTDPNLGSEYWPASLCLGIENASAAVPQLPFVQTGATPPGQTVWNPEHVLAQAYSYVANGFNQCLTVLEDNGQPRARYGFRSCDGMRIHVGLNCVAMQAMNAGGLCSRQEAHAFIAVERLLDLQKLFNAVYLRETTVDDRSAAVAVAELFNPVREVIELKEGQNRYALADTPFRGGTVSDLFAGDECNVTWRVNDPDHNDKTTVEFPADPMKRPAFALVEYVALLACDTPRRSPDEPFSAERLVGLQLTHSLLGRLRTAVENLSGYYCGESGRRYTTETLLQDAIGRSTWTSVSPRDQIRWEYFDEVASAVARLTTLAPPQAPTL